MIVITEQKSDKAVGSTSLIVDFAYNEKIISILKEAGNANWSKRKKQWELPCSKLSFLIDNLTYIDDIELNLLKDEEKETLDLTCNYITKPFDYQLDGIKWLINNPNGLLLDEPGLGKTLQVTYAAEELKKQKGIEHCLIICGINTLKLNWEKEIHKHSDLSCRVIGKRINRNGRIVYNSIKERADELYNKLEEFFIIINVESIRDDLIIDAIMNSKNNFDMIVVDECHKCKSQSTNQGIGLKKLAKVGKYHFGLTGTILINSPLDAYVPLIFINKERAPFGKFKDFYCTQEREYYSRFDTRGHMAITGYKNMELFKEELESCSLRRLKSEVLKDLPEKTIIDEYVEMPPKQFKFYNDIAHKIVEDADRVDIKTKTLLGLIVRLRQAASCPSVLTTMNVEECKIDRAEELARQIVGNGEKVVIISTFKDPIYKLKERLADLEPFIGTGDQDTGQLYKDMDVFQEDTKHKVFIGTLQKMATGLTLTAASYMIILDSPWTSSDFKQACDRVHRVGSTKPVTIYNLIAVGTIDERVKHLVDQKKDMADYLVDDITTTNDELKYLLGVTSL